MSESFQIETIAADKTWALRQHVMWPNKPVEYVQLSNDDTGLHYGLFVDQDMVSVISVFINKDKAQFRKFATQAKQQGKGYGSALLKHVFKVLKKQQIKTIWCNARLDKCGFYQHFGMHKTEHYFKKGHIDYVIMEVQC